MNSKSDFEAYRRTFSVLHPTRDIRLERTPARVSPVLTYALAALVAVGCSVAAVRNYDVIKEYLSWSGNANVSIVREEDGTLGTMVTLHTETLTPPVEFRDGRLVFTAYGEQIDITDKVSVENPYIYRHESDGRTSYIAVGLNEPGNPANFGFAEYVETESGLVGYTAMTNTESDGSGLPWVESAKKIIGVK